MSERTQGMERKQVVMLAALGVVLLGLVYFMFLRGGGEPSQSLDSVAPPDPIAQAESEDPFDPEAEDASTAPVETFEVFASRDPFNPVVEGVSGGGDKAERGASQDPNDEPDDPTEPSSETDNGDEDAVTQTNDVGDQANEEEVSGRSVHLIDVYREGGKDFAQVQVDSTGYTVEPGDIFAENFQLVSTSGTCATMLYGDDQFTLCEGEEILK